ncbi:MAG: hypothetical protein GXP14_03735 [Gammaproteobacteria bacterium]|nr:hypothetical protein [Gammaproteobacteria bacterium]
MGYKSTIRSIGSAVRAAERERQREIKRLEREQRQYDKLAAQDEAREEVFEYEQYVFSLVSIHIDCIDQIHWNEFISRKEPIQPTLRDLNESAAVEKKSGYSPGFLDRKLKRVEKKMALFNQAIEEAKQQDIDQHEELLGEWRTHQSKWKNETEFANRVINGEAEAFVDAITKFSQFDKNQLIGTEIQFSVEDAGLLTVTIMSHGEELIPNIIKSLLASGRVSTKKTPVGKYYELQQDHICSAALRIAREVFAILPIESVLININDKLLNTATGNLEEATILSVFVPRVTIEKFNFKKLDPSDSMSNFKHRMSFKKTKGFTPVVAYTSGDIDPS